MTTNNPTQPELIALAKQYMTADRAQDFQNRLDASFQNDPRLQPDPDQSVAEKLDKILSVLDPFDNSHNDYLRRKPQVITQLKALLLDARIKGAEQLRTYVEDRLDNGGVDDFTSRGYMEDGINKLKGTK